MSNVPRSIYYSKTSSPCKDCEDRQSGCHSKCEKYGEWNKQRIQSRHDNYIAVSRNKMVEDYVMNSVIDLRAGKRRKR